MNGVRAPAASGELKPLVERGRWVASGLALQVIGVGIPVTAALERASKDGVLGSITGYTVRLVWRRSTLLVGVPLAAVAGIAVFGVCAVVFAIVARRSLTPVTPRASCRTT